MAKKTTPTIPPYPIYSDYRIKELIHSPTSSTFIAEKLYIFWWFPISGYFCTIQEAERAINKKKHKYKPPVRYHHR